VLGQLALRLPSLTRWVTAAHAVLFVRTHGLLLGRWFGTSVLVLETVGRRTGKPRAAPMVYLPDGDNLVVVPANGGAERAPAWWLNLTAAGEGIAVLGRERRRVRPLEATGVQRERLWQRFAAVSPLNHYQRQTSRRIPVIILAPAEPASGISSCEPPTADVMHSAGHRIVVGRARAHRRYGHPPRRRAMVPSHHPVRAGHARRAAPGPGRQPMSVRSAPGAHGGRDPGGARSLDRRQSPKRETPTVGTPGTRLIRCVAVRRWQHGQLLAGAVSVPLRWPPTGAAGKRTIFRCSCVTSSKSRVRSDVGANLCPSPSYLS
jgi:deazaflavin-dependent oxidoreductase (nitroreductase family)